MAHLIACAAKAIDFAPRALILIDPAPPGAQSLPLRILRQLCTSHSGSHLLVCAPVVDFPENICLQRLSLRETAVQFLSLQLATLARMTEREDKIEELRERLPLEVEAWDEDALVVRVADRLAQEGLREFTANEVVRVSRQLEAWAESDWLLRNSLAQASADLSTAQPSRTQWDTFLVLASEREQFFEKQKDIGIGKGALGSAAARVYGSIEREMVLNGGHLLICQQYANTC